MSALSRLLVRLLVLCLIASGAEALPPVTDPAADPSARVIAVEGVVDDAAISARVTRILDASDWFTELAVSAEGGLVTLAGTADNTEHMRWAVHIAERTEDVVAVINRLTLTPSDRFNLAPALSETRALWQAFIATLPRFAASAVILIGLAGGGRCPPRNGTATRASD